MQKEGQKVWKEGALKNVRIIFETHAPTLNKCFWTAPDPYSIINI